MSLEKHLCPLPLGLLNGLWNGCSLRKEDDNRSVEGGGNWVSIFVWLILVRSLGILCVDVLLFSLSWIRRARIEEAWFLEHC